MYRFMLLEWTVHQYKMFSSNQFNNIIYCQRTGDSWLIKKKGLFQLTVGCCTTYYKPKRDKERDN